MDRGRGAFVVKEHIKPKEPGTALCKVNPVGASGEHGRRALGKYIDDGLDGKLQLHVCGRGVENCSCVNKKATVFHVAALRKLRSEKLPGYIFEGLDAPPEEPAAKPKEKEADELLEGEESEEEKRLEDLRGVRNRGRSPAELCRLETAAQVAQRRALVRRPAPTVLVLVRGPGSRRWQL
jgi:hypothetical protein